MTHNPRIDLCFEVAHACLAAGRPLVMMLVADAEGSTPGRPGFKMVVPAEGATTGTIGGGIMEFRLLEKARGLLEEGSREIQVIKQVHNRRAPEAEQSGMICAGNQTQLLWPVYPDQKELFDRLVGHYQREEEVILCLEAGRPPSILPPKHDDSRILFTGEGDKWCYRERVGLVDTVVVIGSGHVGLAVCRVLKTLGDFRVVVVDHRDDVATFRNNTFADEKLHMPMENLGERLPVGPHVYVVIVTTSFDSDAEALFQMIDKNTGFLGLMGSKAKIAEIKRQLRARGVAESSFSTVSMPIGLPIDADSPAEIAVSIAAQLILVRSDHRSE